MLLLKSALLLMGIASALPPQNMVRTSVLNSQQYFDGTIYVGAAISRDNGDKYATLGGMLWGSWELIVEWVNLQKGGITIGSEKWALDIIEIEDFSNSTFCNYAASQCMEQFSVPFMFGPYSSGLTKGVVQLTDANKTLMLSSGSSSPSVWDGTVEYGWGLLYKTGGWWDVVLSAYASKGATTAAYLCSTKICGTDAESTTATMTTTFSDSGITLSYYYALDPTSNTYTSDLNNAMATISTANVDLLTIADYSTICIDAVAQADALEWTPSGLFLSICNNDVDVQTAMGSELYYATASSSWSPEASYTSGISVCAVCMS